MAVMDVVESVCSMFTNLAQKAAVELIQFIDPAIPVTVLGDALRLRQVLINLANNAIKFCAKQDYPGRVAVRALLIETNGTQATVEIQVIDNGIGMDEETQVRLFVHTRGGKPPQARSVADNLVTIDGNALTRRVFVKAVAVAVAAGRAPLETNANTGPVTQPAASAPTREEALRHGNLILVAEDNETNQKVIVRQLALLGYAADVSGDGRAALEHWQSGVYALLLTVLHMPQMDGYELTQAIRADEKGARRIPIIALTANALKDEAVRFREIGMNDYRSKPTPRAELKSVLNHWMPAMQCESDKANLRPIQ